MKNVFSNGFFFKFFSYLKLFSKVTLFYFNSVYLWLLFNCSQRKFVAIISVLVVSFMRFFAWPFFGLTHLTFRPQKRDKLVAPSGHQVLFSEPFSSLDSKYSIRRNCFKTYTHTHSPLSLHPPPPPPPQSLPLHITSFRPKGPVQPETRPSTPPPLPTIAPPHCCAHHTPLQLS